jgi:hypothetical protein
VSVDLREDDGTILSLLSLHPRASLVNLWATFGQSLGYFWSIFGLSLGYFWSIFGLLSIHPREDDGTSPSLRDSGGRRNKSVSTFDQSLGYVAVNHRQNEGVDTRDSVSGLVCQLGMLLIQSIWGRFDFIILSTENNVTLKLQVVLHKQIAI